MQVSPLRLYCRPVCQVCTSALGPSPYRPRAGQVPRPHRTRALQSHIARPLLLRMSLQAAPHKGMDGVGYRGPAWDAAAYLVNCPDSLPIPPQALQLDSRAQVPPSPVHRPQMWGLPSRSFGDSSSCSSSGPRELEAVSCQSFKFTVFEECSGYHQGEGSSS